MWADFADGKKDSEIRKYARAIKRVRPYQVIVLIGFEPDLYVPEVNGEGHEKNRGTPEEYVAMYNHFLDIFEKMKVTNAVYAVDYAWEIRDYPDLAVRLWPGPRVDWLFFHVY